MSQQMCDLLVTDFNKVWGGGRESQKVIPQPSADYFKPLYTLIYSFTMFFRGIVGTLANPISCQIDSGVDLLKWGNFSGDFQSSCACDSLCQHTNLCSHLISSFVQFLARHSEFYQCNLQTYHLRSLRALNRVLRLRNTS
jgi:hypothetical protein